MTDLTLPVESPDNIYATEVAPPDFSTLLQNLNGMVYRCRNDADWSVEFVSDGCRALLGIESAALRAGQPGYGSMIHPDDSPMVWQAVQDAIEARQPFQIEYRVRHTDDGWRWVWEQGCGLFDPAGNLQFLEGFVTDITARKNAEQAQRAAAADLDATLRAIPDLLFEMDDTGRYLKVWTNQPDLLAAQRDHLLGHTVDAVLPPPAAATVMAALREAATTGHAQGQQISLPLPQGECWFEISTARKDISDGQPRFIMLSRDITERKTAETALRNLAAELEDRVAERTLALTNKEEEIRSLVDNLVDCVIHIDSRGIVRSANPAVLRILGWHPHELIGQNISMLTPEPHRSAHDGYLERYQRTGEARIIGLGREVEGQHRDGRLIPLELVVSKYWVQGQRFFTGTLRDISARKATVKALQAAKAQAEDANRAKDAFLATMSHEIRTPLGGLLGMLELLSLSPLSPEQAETLATARDSGRSLLRILNDILDWSKIEEARLELALQSTSLVQLVAEVANIYAHVASGNSVSLTQRVDTRLSPAHRVDPLRLSQVLNNFVSNAIKFSHGCRVELSAELIARHDGAEEVRFSVKDTGIGIDPAAQQRLFRSYSQANADTARMYGGTGLGLAICRRLAKLMDGRIELHSAPGRGSTFSITLTLPITEAVPEPTPAQDASDAVTFAPPLVAGVAAADAPRVLVVDDNLVNRKLLARQLGLLGLRSATAENGEAALTLWRAGDYALVVTDCHMPVMDGYALTRAIRASEAAAARPRTPVFAWTANALAEEIDNCHAAGMDELLVKPAELVQLKQVLAKWLPAVAVPDLRGEPAVAVPPAPTVTTLDVGVLRTLVGDDPATIAEFLQDFRHSAASIAAELTTAWNAGDLASVGAAAHKLKSSSRAVGALALGELCARLEAAGKAGDGPAITARVPEFVAGLAAVITAIGEKKN
jgi:PAS domain S-box-containing protein